MKYHALFVFFLFFLKKKQQKLKVPSASNRWRFKGLTIGSRAKGLGYVSFCYKIGRSWFITGEMKLR